ncbi:peptide/nickel transport system ATP-binding protein [Promicromonospora sp. AC04]|uniref:dipeptide ABC transporter ATP-binding protein n=1 Tax=Promicromonospora sp. AC04 TaxID=2135723 RepID=UPI000D3DC997|nr:ABC transporter ATP-binding protein [Promicromonospora sp. AC04]PUB31536.1 peptide/nickel transport system ATP-binding protein [Promicromonospora sp. AC04]
MTVTATAPAAGVVAPASSALLCVEGLSVAYGRTEVVSDVSFSLERGESLALIGESGSGKSTIARSVLRLLPDGGAARGRVEFEGRDVLALPERQFRPLRGRALGFVPQDPGSSLNAVRTIGAQAQEAAALTGERDAGVRQQLILDTFAQVGLDDPRRAYDSYPHQLSGGMLQRVLIGLAVLPRPALLVADEPTSALDVTIQKRILDLLSELRADLGIGLLLITHDLAIAAERADSLVVLRDGAVQEAGPTATVFAAPSSAYARELQADVPALNPDRYRALREGRSPSAPAVARSVDLAVAGGAGLAVARDVDSVAVRDLDPVAVRSVDPADPAATAPVSPPVAASEDAPDATPKIELRGVTKSFTVEGRRLTALDGVSFAIERGTTHALVGESGSGKTTAVRLLLGLDQADDGEILVAGEPVHGRSAAGLRAVRRHLQLVYQNPFTSLDPTWRVEQLVREPLDRFRIGGRAVRAGRVREALAAVGLAEHLLSRRPAALSGGQRQRVAIARALVLRPDVLVLDEPTSALDVTVQADIVEVLVRLQAELGLTYVFVSHDLALVRQLADTVSVLHRGRVVEAGPVERIFADPERDYTRRLLESIPRPGVPDAVAS